MVLWGQIKDPVAIPLAYSFKELMLDHLAPESISFITGGGDQPWGKLGKTPNFPTLLQQLPKVGFHENWKMLPEAHHTMLPSAWNPGPDSLSCGSTPFPANFSTSHSWGRSPYPFFPETTASLREPCSSSLTRPEAVKEHVFAQHTALCAVGPCVRLLGNALMLS